MFNFQQGIRTQSSPPIEEKALNTTMACTAHLLRQPLFLEQKGRRKWKHVQSQWKFKPLLNLESFHSFIVKLKAFQMNNQCVWEGLDTCSLQCWHLQYSPSLLPRVLIITNQRSCATMMRNKKDKLLSLFLEDNSLLILSKVEAGQKKTHYYETSPIGLPTLL